MTLRDSSDESTTARASVFSNGPDCGTTGRLSPPTREVELLTAEGASGGRVEVVPPCCDLAVGDFEDTHDRHRYLDTVLTA